MKYRFILFSPWLLKSPATSRALQQFLYRFCASFPLKSSIRRIALWISVFKATHPANPNHLPKSFQNPHDKPETFNPEPQTLNRACKVGLQLEDHRLACRETPRSRSGSELAWNVVLELVRY